MSAGYTLLGSSRWPLVRVLAYGLVPLTIIFLLFRFAGSDAPVWKHLGASSSSHSTLLDDTVNRTLGFQKVFVINLPSRTDHRDATSMAAHFTGLDLEYVEGVTEVDPKTLPPAPEGFETHGGGTNSWRAHLNVARLMIERNIATALVMEDDIDWDLHIKQQMRQFAQASQLLLQPLPGVQDRYLDPSLPRRGADDKQEDFNLNSGPIAPATSSPYGDTDRWDLLWLGHCGARWPNAKEQPEVPLGRVVIPDDETVPQTQHLNYETGDDFLTSWYANHTRVVHSAAGNTCSFAYALTLAGARALVYEFGLRKIDSAFDQMLPDLCVGRGSRQGRRRVCLTVQPALLQHFRPMGLKGSWSEIDSYANDKAEYNKQSSTVNIRWSAKLSLERLVDGSTDYIDQFPDGMPRPDIGW